MSQIRLYPTGLDKLADRIVDRILIPAAIIGVETAKAYCPVDTSSLQTDIRYQNADVINNNPSIEIAAGGGDYTNQLMSKTGKQGKFVNYALIQETKHGFLENGLMSMYEEVVK